MDKRPSVIAVIETAPPRVLSQDLPEKTLEAQLQDLEQALRELPTYKRLDRGVIEQRIKILKERIRKQDEEEAELDESGHWRIDFPPEHPTVRLLKLKKDLEETPESRPALRKLQQRMVQRVENEIRVLNGELPLPLVPDEDVCREVIQEAKNVVAAKVTNAPGTSDTEHFLETGPSPRIEFDSAGEQTPVIEEAGDGPGLIGLRPVAAVVMALWYALAAGGAMSTGFAYLYEHSKNDYSLTQNLMWIIGIGVGVAIAAYLARNSQWAVGAVSSLIMSCVLLSLLFSIPSDQPGQISLLGFTPSASNFMIGVAILTLLSGLLGTSLGIAMRADESLSNTILGIRHRHWFWLWLPLYAWVSIFPTAIYYVWLEVISTGYVLIHPSLWFDEAWTEGWTITFGFAGFAAVIYGIGLSLDSVSSTRSTNVRTRTRVLRFLLGTLVMVGPVANVLFRIAIHSLKHLPDGITANPWWVLR